MSANDRNADDLGDKVMDVIRKQAEARKEAEYRAWCDDFESVPPDFTLILKNGLVAQVELQPWRWIQHGLDLIGSRKAAGTIQLFGGKEGPDFRSYLPYPVFQMGAEVFLKGMWLYQYEKCRGCTADSYIEPDVRNRFFNEVKDQGHDLLKIIQKVQEIGIYAKDPELSRFLKILGGISRRYYLPLSGGKTRWADERYPKRFYNDAKKIGRADAFQSYPVHWPLVRLFTEAADRLQFVWERNEE